MGVCFSCRNNQKSHYALAEDPPAIDNPGYSYATDSPHYPTNTKTGYEEATFAF